MWKVVKIVSVDPVLASFKAAHQLKARPCEFNVSDIWPFTFPSWYLFICLFLSLFCNVHKKIPASNPKYFQINILSKSLYQNVVVISATVSANIFSFVFLLFWFYIWVFSAFGLFSRGRTPALRTHRAAFPRTQVNDLPGNSYSQRMSFYRSSALRCRAEKLISDAVQQPRRARGPPLCGWKRWRTPEWYAGAGGVSLEEVEEIEVEGEI